MKRLFYRLNQKLKYHLALNVFSKRVAEINRHQKIVKCSNKYFSIEGSDINFEIQSHQFILEQFELFLKLLNDSNCSFYLEEKILIAEFNKLKLPVTTPEEIFIIHEIWLEGVYNFSTFNQENLIVIDVGMNVAFASLFFASKKNVMKVYSYEPFKSTFKQGQKNLALNPLLSKRIEAHHFGLSAIEELIEVDYSPKHRGRTGIWGTELILEKMTEVRKEKLFLKSFNEVISSIMRKHSKQEFILKIDCEGSEYDIFKNLDDTLLKPVKCIMMEWHRNGPQAIEKKLISNGFTILSFNPNSTKVGMLYAFK